MRAAIVYDRVNKFGGAERVLLALHEMFPEAPLYTSIYSPQKAPWANVFPKVFVSWLNKIPFLRENHELLSIFMPIAFESFNFDEYDLVISVSSEAAKGVITKPGTHHICYLLTPTRYLWSGEAEYINHPPKKLRWIPFFKHLSKPFFSYVRNWDVVASQRPDKVIAISSEVKNRIKKYYARNSQIIFPPVDTERFQTPTTVHRPQTTDYYLIVSRLEPYKKVDLAVKAFNKLGYRLLIVGVGGEEKYLRSIANKNIEFIGFTDDEAVTTYFQKAKAFIFPQEEDFGITAVEAQAAGCPVVAYKKGGALDTVIDPSASSGRVSTGVFFNEQNVKSLMEAIKRFEKMKFDKAILQKNAERFNKKIFKKQILDLVKISV